MIPANEVGEAIVRFIAPYVPILFHQLGEGAVKKAGADTFDAAKSLYQQLWTKAEGDEDTRDALAQLANAPEDAPELETLQQALQERLIALLEREQALTQSLAERLINAGQLARRDISAQLIENSAAISGDNNTVTQNFNEYNTQAAPKPTRTAKASNVPLSSRIFVGRDEVLISLHERLSQGETVAIQGMGGVGKTELARQYAQQNSEDYPGGMCWLQARNLDVASQIVTFAKVYLELDPPEGLNLTAQVAYCWSHWPIGETGSDANEQVLVVYDDVTDYKHIADVLPPADGRFRVLMTTRRQHLATTVEPFEIKVLSEESALALLKQIAGIERVELELKTATAVCQWLGCLPLGLELVGQYLRQKPDLTFTILQQRLNTQRLEARALNTAYPGMTEQRGVAEAFELSWGAIEQAHKGTQDIACCLSLFALAPIPWTLAELPVEDSRKEDFEEGRDVLVSLSLLQRVDTGLYQLHQLIREYLQAKLSQGKTEIPIKRQYCQMMVSISQLVPRSPVEEFQVWLAPCIPHITEAATTLRHWLDEGNLTLPFVALGRFYESQGDYKQAKAWYEESVMTSKQRFGECHRDVAGSLLNLSGIYSDQGLYTQAETLCKKALMILEQLGDENSLLATGLNSLGLIHIRQGSYDSAEPLLRRSVEINRLLSPDGSPDEAIPLNNLGLLHFSKGDYGEAELFYKKALDMYEKVVSNGFLLDAIQVLHNLADVYMVQESYEEAKTRHEHLLELRQQLFREEHPDVANSFNAIAGIHMEQKQYDKAEQSYTKALEIRLKLFGKTHPDVATSFNNLGGLRFHQKKYDEAEVLYEQALAMRHELFPDGHWSIAESLDNLALIKASKGNYEEAESLCNQALALYHDLLGEEHIDFAICLSNLARIYVMQKHYEQAESLYFHAIHTWENHLGREHPVTKRGLNFFVNFIAATIKANQQEQLSNHPVTQKYISLIQEQLGSTNTSH